MSDPRYGASFNRPNAAAMVATIRRAEELGIPTVWLTTGGSPDSLTVFAAAAATTQRIRFGTAIVPTFPRHPLVTASQALDIHSLAPGRFTLGVGPSHKASIEGRFGIAFERPLEHLREYVSVLKAIFTTGAVDLSGKRFSIHGSVPNGKADIPVIISALQERSFALAGEIADGAVTWICPARYLAEVGLPALRAGAEKAGRAAPPLIAHAFISVTEDRAAMREAAGTALANYPRLTSYASMFAVAGYPEALQGTWSEAMLDAVVLQGTEDEVQDQARAFRAIAGAEQLILSVLPVGPDPEASLDRALRCIAAL